MGSVERVPVVLVSAQTIRKGVTRLVLDIGHTIIKRHLTRLVLDIDGRQKLDDRIMDFHLAIESMDTTVRVKVQATREVKEPAVEPVFSARSQYEQG